MFYNYFCYLAGIGMKKHLAFSVLWKCRSIMYFVYLKEFYQVKNGVTLGAAAL